jgi:uncharacterized protein YggT (Ycf19 family)
MADYLEALYQLIGSLIAPLVNVLTEWLNGFLPIDLAKAVTVIAFYLAAMTVIKYLQ